MKKHAKVVGLGLGLAALTGGALVAEASDAESLAQLRLLVYKANEYGFRCRDHAKGEPLPEGGSYMYRTTFSQGTEYFVVGAGDGTVRDLDIYLYDERGNEISRDTQSDALPIVEVTPRWTGTFYVKVHMYSGWGYSNYAVCYR